MNPFALAYREQQQLFLFDKTYILGTLLKVGGLSTLLARFIVQFFWNKTAALGITLALLALSSFLTWAFVRKTSKDWKTIPLCLIPSVFIWASLSDIGLHFDFLTSILLIQTGLLIFKNIKSRKLMWGLILTIILYLTAGSAAVLFAVCAAIREKSWKSLCYLAVVAFCGIVAYLTAAIPTWYDAFTPSFYYNLDASLPGIHWAGRICLPIIILINEFVGSCRLNRWLILTSEIVLFAVSCFPARKITNKFEGQQPILTYKFEYYTNREDWDGLIKACEKAPWLPRTANYLNMALSWKGELTEHLLDYDQRGPGALVMMIKDRAVDDSQAHIMMTMGNVAAAQDVAFNLLFTLQGYCPAMVKINAVVELMRGSYDIADKYLSLLEKAPHYRRWAKSYRRFLYDDDRDPGP